MDDDLLARFSAAYWRAFRELDTVRLRHWERSNLTLPQLRVLFQVRRTPGITTGELARLLGITVSTASGLAIKLVERGLLVRGTSAEDRRQAPLSLSDDAAALLDELSDSSRLFVRRAAGALGDDLEWMTAALERLADAAAAARNGRPESAGAARAPATAEASS